ncbi:c-type cytochrome [Solitalea koreensis]|uniref:Cytochrome C oxidase, cbb3-type, subunit III n=1 Tax=Solitalea koreensis TaxID=543615 RepID=A0A521BME8_9SPHI|nr:cytochrome c [Solitalea koreensis]SMO47941.1 Cytochrome C oxidase, cbb3-type, subunit III [Solitalea koreensis]
MKNRIIFSIFTISAFIILITSCSNPNEIKEKQYYTEGMYLYKKHCQSCHMEDGRGLGELIPPLAKADFLVKNKDLLSCIIKKGINNVKVTVNGKDYQSIMPANEGLGTIEIAEIITYITNSWGNKTAAYTIEEVEMNLKKCL